MDDVCEGKDSSFPLCAKLDAFHELLRRMEGGEEFVFYDGPPFAMCLPHYGHILAGTIKDAVTRHQSMRGRHVSGRFGWDCHGLPVEFEIDSALGTTNRRQVEWEAVFTRSGWWIDIIYKGFKAMPYSRGCKNALSNFEATRKYRIILDLAVMVSFPIVGDADNSPLVAWTTTPWTLPSNLVLCVNANLTYAKVKDKSNGAIYVIAQLGQLPVKAKASGKKQTPSKGSNAEAVQDVLDKESYELLAKTPGSSLVGLKFVKVEKIKYQLLECDKETYWVPDFVKEKRFSNWLEGARDWAVSRSRFWGTPLPLWMNRDGEEIVVMDSIKKLKKLSGVQVTDLHRHYVDDITIPSKRRPEFGVLKRVDDVFDCWFESGSMPYAYFHYPFENQELFEKNFPGNFVAEGLDQTRGRFYTLMVLSTALFGKPVFKNLICNGLVLAEDSKKMSKSKNNYSSPKDLIDKYGAVVLYLIKYIDYLTNIYVCLNRKRFKGCSGDEDCRVSFSTLYHVLVTTCMLMAPFTPFFTEALYQNLWKMSSKSEESIHFCKFPSTAGESDDRVEQSVNRMVTIIDLARNIHEWHNKALKTPLKEMVVVHPNNELLEDITGKLEEYFMEDNKRQKQQEHIQPNMENFVTFFVKVEGASIPVRQNLSTTTTKMLVEYACSRKGIRDCDSFAVYLGKVLCEDKLLSDYKICSNGTIDIRIRGRAGRERIIQCTTFDEEMKDVDRFSEIKLPFTLTNHATQAKTATFLSGRSQHYAREVLISLCRVHFRKKCFNGNFSASQILFHEGRAVFDESCIESDFTEQGCKKDFLVIAQLFTFYFLIAGTYPLYVGDLVQYLSTCPLGANSNSVEAIALLVNHPALISFAERIAQCSVLDSMVEKLPADELYNFAQAVGSSFAWGEVATLVPGMLDVLQYDPRKERKKGKGKGGNSDPAQVEESAYYTEDPRSCLKFSRNYFKHTDLLLVKVEAAFSLNLENFLPLLLRDIVMKLKGPSTLNIVILLGDPLADRKRKKDFVDTENLAEETALPAKRPKK